MKEFIASALIDAPPQDVYAVIADYHDGHQRIIPRPPFVALDVLEGGTGAGTIANVSMRVMGRVQTTRCVVTEPEPGRVLVESYDSGYETTFIVEPRDDGRKSYVSFVTRLPGRSGLRASIELWLAKRLLYSVYLRELAQLAEVVAKGRTAQTGER